MRFEGYIRDIRYRPHMADALKTVLWTDFDINAVRGAGIIQFDAPHDALAISRWISPKRTRSYPFARLYSTYAQSTRILTVIPVIKDEGAAGDCDRINAMTFSWMSLMNVYIVLAWYDRAIPARLPGKITRQQVNAAYVRDRIAAVRDYRASALHWNTSHFQEDFESVFTRAVQSYQEIGTMHNIPMHNPADHLRVLEAYRTSGVFDLDRYRASTLFGSAAAAQRELGVSHRYEKLQSGAKAIFRIENYLGGEYFLTADEVFQEGEIWIIQEAKHSQNGLMPKKSDIQDGLFKLILFLNLDKLSLNGQAVRFQVRLRLTGLLKGRIDLPTSLDKIAQFCAHHMLSPAVFALIELLDREAHANPWLTIHIGGGA